MLPLSKACPATLRQGWLFSKQPSSDAMLPQAAVVTHTSPQLVMQRVYHVLPICIHAAAVAVQLTELLPAASMTEMTMCLACRRLSWCACRVRLHLLVAASSQLHQPHSQSSWTDMAAQQQRGAAAQQQALNSQEGEQQVLLVLRFVCVVQQQA